MSRRLRTMRVRKLIEQFEHAMRDALPRTDIKLIDGRPLCIGGCSKDADAASGYGAGHRVRGYKLHLLTDQNGAVDHWLLTPMNGSETGVAMKMLPHARDAAYILGDGNYDTNQLYDEAGDRGIRWLTQPRRANSRARGHRKISPYRDASWDWVRDKNNLRMIRKKRNVVERVNAWQGHAAIGLGPLPHHVRRTHRVQLWVAMKLIIYHHWLSKKAGQCA